MRDVLDTMLWDRIGPSLDPSSKILLVSAPPGSVRHRFAKRWLGDNGELLGPDIGPRETADLLRSSQENPSSRRVAAFLPADHQTASLARDLGCDHLRHHDLFLSHHEVSRLARLSHQDSQADRIWDLTGGWPRGVLMLLSDPFNEEAVGSAFGRSMMPWLNSIDADGILAESAFLPELSDALLTEFYGDRHTPPPQVSDLIRSGLAVRLPGGDGKMPALLRRALLENQEWENPERAVWLHQQAVEALQATGDTTEAAQTALATRSWSALKTVLIEGWTDFATTNPLFLVDVGRRLPRWMTRRSEIYGPAMKVASAAASDRMVIPFPASKPDYAADRTAHRLRAHAIDHSRRPNAEALFVGLIELGILRFHGHYGAQGREAAQRLRATALQATATGAIRPSLQAMVELQVGITLHLAEDRWAAIDAYKAAFVVAASTNHDFLAADAAGKLALLKAQQGDPRMARDWLQEFTKHHRTVRWGRDMVARSARMAEAYLAFQELDPSGMHEALQHLPAEPDNDELWAVHALVLVAARVGDGTPETAEQLLDKLESARPYAASSPLARRCLAHARALTAPIARSETLLRQAAAPEVIFSLAVKHLRAGDAPGALDIMTADQLTTAVMHDSALRRNIGLATRYREEPLTVDLVEQVVGHYRSHGKLPDLLPLWMSGHGPQIQEALGLGPQDIEKLDKFATPEVRGEWPRLTPREQEVLEGLRSGRSRAELAADFFVSTNTIKTQVSSLYRKLGVRTKHEALEVSMEWGY